MIEESTIKSNFIGRDGFRWWVGQIPPMESMSEQFEGQGWGNRFKVRILGYHTLDENELPNEDLPWAIVMLGTTDGTGSANFAKSTKIRPGDVVFGFFIDGDNAQNPVIMGLLGNTDRYLQSSGKKHRFNFRCKKHRRLKEQLLVVVQLGKNYILQTHARILQ